MSTPRDVDRLTRQNKVTLPEIRRAIPEQYMSPRALLSWWALLRVFISIGICVYVLSFIHINAGPGLLWQCPALVVMWILYGWVLVGLFVIGHDCGHHSFSRKPWVNTVVGHVCMSPLANSFHTWKLTHNQHHAHTQLRGHEVDWASRLVTKEEFESTGVARSWITRLGYRLPFGIVFWIAWNTVRRAFMIRSLLPAEQYAREKGRLVRSGVIMMAVVAMLYGGLWYAVGFFGMIKFYGIPSLIAMATGSIIITIQHANEHTLLYEKEHWTPIRGQMVSTFDVRFPAWLECLWFDINIHIPHHVAPTIPWYYLKRVARSLQLAYPLYYQEQPFGTRHFMWWRRTPFLKKIENEGYYAIELR